MAPQRVRDNICQYSNRKMFAHETGELELNMYQAICIQMSYKQHVHVPVNVKFSCHFSKRTRAGITQVAPFY
jgi:hypothetical protein